MLESTSNSDLSSTASISLRGWHLQMMHGQAALCTTAFLASA
jgi:hypothetical protein